MSRLSPLMEQYYRLKKEYPDALLLFRVGDFYETFAEDAVVVSRDLNITLTSRQKDDEGCRIPLAGVPYHALDVYLSRLVKAGHKVAICEQVEDPKTAKGLVKREITRVVTPGTVIEPSMLEESSNNYLAAVVEEETFAGLALVDVSTGEFLAAEIPSERLAAEMARFRPAECLAASPRAYDQVRVQLLEESCFSLENASASLEERFGPEWTSWLKDKELAIRACGAVLAYLHRSHFDALGHLNEIRLYSTADFMVLDEITLRNLEILRNIRDRSRRGTLLDYLGQTRTPMGARTLAKWIQMPLLQEDLILERLDSVEELLGDPLLRESLGQELRETSDLERLVGRISCGSAAPKDLILLKNSLQRLPSIVKVMEGTNSDLLKRLRVRLAPQEELVALIDRAIVDDPPSNLRDGGVIRDGFDQDLDQVRTVLRDGRGWISQLETSERKRTKIKSLKVGYNNVFGYYLEVSRPNLSLVPENYVRKQTLASAERFITPELKEMETRVLSAQERSTTLEAEIFNRLRLMIGSHCRKIQSLASALGELDVICAFSLAARENNLVRPEFNDQGSIALRAARHPVLDRAMRGSFVPNDVYLNRDDSRLVILTGPNMAGKSTFMRQIALAVIMAQSGSFVAASHATISLVDRIFTRVGAYDDLSAGQSTFMVEMTEVANILTQAGRDSLVLLDEVGRGTSTFDGLSLAWAISEHLHNVIRAKAVFATHYHQLTQLEDLLPGVKNYSIAAREEKGSIVFLRTVVPGATDKSYGVQVARLAGVPSAVTRRAEQILKEIESEVSIEPLAGKKSARKSRYTQLIFFDSPEERVLRAPEKDPLLDEIAGLDLDDLTPRQALDKLAKLQEIVRGRYAQD
ncbi:MAG: DNA mismatch repair protein MutS [Methanotrichaceae archaeon]|nr:DNA mismatch repair protein MutS [Methanotrichaceae archaeon]